MSSTERVSDEEVSRAIRYLDPDLQHGLQISILDNASSSSARWHRAGLMIALPCLSFYFYVQRYFSAVIRLFN
jgi:hypothetical protein